MASPTRRPVSPPLLPFLLKLLTFLSPQYLVLLSSTVHLRCPLSSFNVNFFKFRCPSLFSSALTFLVHQGTPKDPPSFFSKPDFPLEIPSH